MTDLGIAQIKNHNPEFKNYIVLENIVYNELIYLGYEVFAGKTRNSEIDFVAKKDGINHINLIDFLLNENLD